jgi:phage baseplate assembly protein W
VSAQRPRPTASVGFVLRSFDSGGDSAPDGERGGGLFLDARGALALVRGAQAVRQSLLLLLSTVPGERVMRPDYGCALHRLPFAPNDDTTAGLAIHYVRQAITRFEPRVKIVSLDARPHGDDPALLEIELEYRLRASGERGALSLALSLAPALTPAPGGSEP